MGLGVTYKKAGLVLGVVLWLGAPASADDWDQASDTDNGNGTDNVLLHGTEQTHDLAALPGPVLDEDWFLVPVHPFSSYQFVVDGQTGDLALSSGDVMRVTADGAALDSGFLVDGVRSLTWMKAQGPSEEQFVRVRGAACGTACDERDRYRARFYDTTYTVPRFNNSATQTTLVIIQNASKRTCDMTLFFLDSLGQLVLARNVPTLAPESLRIVGSSEATSPSGSVRIAHTCGYGGLAGKAVSIEPATGFTFDTPVLPRPR